MFSSTVNPYTDYVHFINASYGLRAIRAIRLDFYCPFGKTPRILFKISPFNKQELKDIFRNFFSDTSDLISLGGLIFQIALNKQSLEKIFAIFDVLNAQNEHEAFPEILKSELLNIYNFKTGNTCHGMHLIPEQPFLKKSSKILRLFLENPKDTNPQMMENTLKALLVKGENPNAKNTLGATSLGMAIGYSENLVFLLLCYGADPLISASLLNGYSAIEMAKSEPENIYTCIETWLKSPVYHARPSKTVSGVDLIPTRTSIRTVISMEDNSQLWSELKSVQDLDEDERTALFPLYRQAFHAEDGDIAASFEHAFSPASGKLIDILRNDQGKIIGADVSLVKKTEDSIYVYIDLSFLDPRFRGAGIMPLVNFRLPFALQDLYERYQVYILFLSASYPAIRRVEKTLFFPKFQTENMATDLQNTFLNIFNYPLQWKKTADEAYWTVQEEHQVSVSPVEKKRRTGMETFYYKHLCGSQNAYVPVMLHPGIDFLRVLHAVLATHQINFLSHCRELAKILSETRILAGISPEFVKTQASGRIYESHAMFWNKKRIPVDENIIRHAFSEPPLNHKWSGKL